MVKRVIATDSAEQLTARLITKYGPVMFHLSGGCCDGSALMCYLRHELLFGPDDIPIGEVAGSPFYIKRALFEYFGKTQLIVDIVEGRGGTFSLEGPEGYSFYARSRLFSDDEQAELASAGPAAMHYS